jgi:hypothetical protein
MQAPHNSPITESVWWQVEAACELPWLEEVVLDFLEVHGLREACTAVKAAGKRCVVATLRISKPGEERLLSFYLRLRPHALLLRSAGLLQQLTELRTPAGECPWLYWVPCATSMRSRRRQNVLCQEMRCQGCQAWRCQCWRETFL